MGTCANIVKYGKNMFKNADVKKLSPKNWDWQKIVWPFRVLIHPVQAFTEIKYEKRGSVGLSFIVLLLWFFSKIFQYLETGFIFNQNEASELNSFMLFMGSDMVIILLAISNWAICTLMDGEGWFKDIWITFCYSVMPQVITIIPVAIITNYLTIEEEAFVSLISTITFIWMLLLVFIANTTVHQYTIKKSLGAMLLTILGVLILLMIFVLVVSLFMQVYDLVGQLVKEIKLRMV
ncbi:MAG: Yip1 family protein [Acutalibacteraceae bacterium]|nr:Yip1 family protein [Acutalibacteraceae bacterium]